MRHMVDWLPSWSLSPKSAPEIVRRNVSDVAVLVFVASSFMVLNIWPMRTSECDSDRFRLNICINALVILSMVAPEATYLLRHCHMVFGEKILKKNTGKREVQ